MLSQLFKQWHCVAATLVLTVLTKHCTHTHTQQLEIDYQYYRLCSLLELWGQHIFPGDVNKTHPSREKYYYMEGSDGVKLPGAESRKPHNWTAEDLMSDLEEFLGDSFRIAHILDGTPF